MPIAGLAVPALISGAFSVGSTLLGNNASKNAQQQQISAQQQMIENTKKAVSEGQGLVTDAAGNADSLLSGSADKSLDFYKKYVDAGGRSLTDLEQLTGGEGPLTDQFHFGTENLDNDAGFQYTLKQGQDAIARSQAARGGLFSRNTLDAQSADAMSEGNKYFNEAFGRAKLTFDTNRKGALDRITSLQDLAKLGYAGSAASADTTTSTGVRRAGVLTDAARTNAGLGVAGTRDVNRSVDDIGDFNAAGIVGRSNNWQSTIGNVSKGIQDTLLKRSQKNSSGSKGVPGLVNLGLGSNGWGGVKVSSPPSEYVLE